MRITLTPGDENAENIFSSVFTNRENVSRNGPSRAYRKIPGVANDRYFTEVFIPIRQNEIESQKGYQKFDELIDKKVKSKEVTDNINIISFFGDEHVNPMDIVKFEDVGLLSNFETLFNDHMICTPYSFNLHHGSYEDIFSRVTSIFDSFSTTLNSKNLLGYVPVYVNYREIEKLVTYYSGKDMGNVSIGTGSKLNAIPLMIDFKGTNPDTHRRSVAKINELKIKYMKEGYYPIIYAYNVSRPRMSKNKRSEIAKEFLLSFLGFDLIGASKAMVHAIGGNSRGVNFNLEDFTYTYSEKYGNTSETNKMKSLIYYSQSLYLGTIHQKTLENSNYISKEMERRPKVKEYIKEVTG
ncbi:hypothetical protein ACNF42_07345 [Cuniculiplasma sp. SKW3]|uniref:hypothetical protein n=1 Tax=Cuniculiplasma sp. SKW3 TaxID=3400170 RepID=UPI003FD41D9F